MTSVGVCGILLAGGTGSRLMPLTMTFSKHFLPVYSKPLFYYSLCNLILCGIRRILIICTDFDKPIFEEYLRRNNFFGLEISILVQAEPAGIPDAFRIGAKFIKNDNVILSLGDNIFYGSGLGVLFRESCRKINGARIFGYEVTDPSRFGVVEIGESGELLSLEEKPTSPRSNVAVTGLYMFDNSIIEKAHCAQPSMRGELEILDILNEYLELGRIDCTRLPRGTTWFDAGTTEALKVASDFVEAIETRTNELVCSPEELSYRFGWIPRPFLDRSIKENRNSKYFIKLDGILN